MKHILRPTVYFFVPNKKYFSSKNIHFITALCTNKIPILIFKHYKQFHSFPFLRFSQRFSLLKFELDKTGRINFSKILDISSQTIHDLYILPFQLLWVLRRIQLHACPRYFTLFPFAISGCMHWFVLSSDDCSGIEIKKKIFLALLLIDWRVNIFFLFVLSKKLIAFPSKWKLWTFLLR